MNDDTPPAWAISLICIIVLRGDITYLRRPCFSKLSAEATKASTLSRGRHPNSRRAFSLEAFRSLPSSVIISRALFAAHMS
jgi:hypothetical protein